MTELAMKVYSQAAGLLSWCPFYPWYTHGQLTQVLHLQNHFRITDLGICSSMSMPSLHIQSTGSTLSQDIPTVRWKRPWTSLSEMARLP